MDLWFLRNANGQTDGETNRHRDTLIANPTGGAKNEKSDPVQPVSDMACAKMCIQGNLDMSTPGALAGSFWPRKLRFAVPSPTSAADRNRT